MLLAMVPAVIIPTQKLYSQSQKPTWRPLNPTQCQNIKDPLKIINGLLCLNRPSNCNVLYYSIILDSILLSERYAIPQTCNLVRLEFNRSVIL